MNRLLKEAEKYTIYITVFLLPLVFSPMFFNGFLTIKIALLVLGVAIALIIRLIRMATTGSFEYSQGPFDFPVFLIGLAYLLSGLYASPNRAEAFFLPGAATIVITSAVLYFLANQLEALDKDRLIYAILGSSFLVALIYLLAITGLYEKIGALPAFMRTRNFTPQGALLPTGMLLLISIVYSVGLIRNTKDYLYKVIIGCVTAIMAISLVLASFNMLTDRANFKLASFDSSLAVVFDSLKTSSLLGVGPSNYLTAYTRFRPLSANQGDDWTARYTHARNFYLTAITETGLAGTFAIILLLIVVARMVNTEVKQRERARLPIIDSKIAAIFVLLVLFLLFPATSPEIVVLMFVGLAVASKTRKFRVGAAALAQQVHLGDSKSSRVPAVIVMTPLLLGIAYLLIMGGRALAAERTYKVALDHLSKNEGSQAYQSLQSAINGSPTIDRYHATYSQINFLLANALASKKDLSDEDRNTITQLIQQSIREAKTTVALNPARAGNWEILGSTYRNIMTLSKDAAGFAVQSYGQAVALDPLNPNLRIALGGVWYSVKNYENAIDTFKLAVIAKPDHANARYNLASAYKEKGDTERAIAELKVVLTLLKSDSKDYEKAKSELDALESKKAASAPKEGESLTTPAGSEQKLNPGVELPESLGPDITPTPSATAIPSASPTATP